MSDLTAWEKKSKIRKGEPLTQTFNGETLTFYPITMAYYEEFLELKPVLTLRQGSLSAKYIALPFLSALWAVDYDSVVASGQSVGFFERFIRLLYLCLRLGYEREKAFENIYTEARNARNLMFVDLPTEDGKTVRLTPLDISFVIRPLIAEQNGVELPDESFNMDLVAAERIMNEDSAAKIEYSTDTLISSVAYISGVKESEIDDWTVLQFERRREAIERDKYFMLYTAAELGGMVKFPNGNPYKSWCFNTKHTSSAVTPINELQQKHRGIGDVEAAISQSRQTQQ